MKTQNIEQIFKDTFSNFEADVNPNAWTNISQGLQTPAPAQLIPGGKTTGMFGKLSVNNAILFLAITASIVGAVIYFSTNKNDSVIDAPQAAKENTVTPSAEPVVLNHINPYVIKNTSSETHIANNAGEQKPATGGIPVVENSDKAKEKGSVSNSANDTPPAPENVIHQENKSAVQKPGTGNNNNSNSVTPPVNNRPDEVNPTVNSETEISASEPSYSDIISVPETDSKNLSFYVPNAFSPNGDLVNEDFTPMGLNFKEYELTIFDRGGHEIFKSKDIANKWDGKLRDGSPAPAEVYIYLINVKDMNNEVHPYTGSITLKR